MERETVLVTIECIFKLAEQNDKVLYDAWKAWSESTLHEDEQVKYQALVELVHPNGGLVIGMPLSYSHQVNLWRACDVIKKMIVAEEKIIDWSLVDLILKDNTNSKSFLNFYFRKSQKEKIFEGIPSLQNRLQGKYVA